MFRELLGHSQLLQEYRSLYLYITDFNALRNKSNFIRESTVCE